MEDTPLPAMVGGKFLAKTDAQVLEIDVSDFDTCKHQYLAVAKEREGHNGYIASFLAALEMFSLWPWSEVLELSYQVKTIQVDKGLYLISQGDRVDGLHIIHQGEAQLEFSNDPARRPAGFGSAMLYHCFLSLTCLSCAIVLIGGL